MNHRMHVLLVDVRVSLCKVQLTFRPFHKGFRLELVTKEHVVKSNFPSSCSFRGNVFILSKKLFNVSFFNFFPYLAHSNFMLWRFATFNLLASLFFLWRHELVMLDVTGCWIVLNFRVSVDSLNPALQTWEDLVTHTFGYLVHWLWVGPITSMNCTWNPWVLSTSSVKLIVLTLQSLDMRVMNLDTKWAHFIRFAFLLTTVVSSQLTRFFICPRYVVRLEEHVLWLSNRERGLGMVRGFLRKSSTT